MNFGWLRFNGLNQEIIKKQEKIMCITRTALKNIYAIIITLISSLAVCFTPVILEKYNESNKLLEIIRVMDTGLKANAIESGLIFLFLWILISKVTKKSMDVVSLVLAVLFALCTLFGKSYTLYNSWNVIFGNECQMIVALIILCGYTFLFYALLCLVYSFLDEKNVRIDNQSNWKFKPVKYEIIVFLLILICWSPYIYVFFPGSVPHDGYYQLNMAYGVNPASNHHPWLSTMVLGAITSIGCKLSDNLGIFLYVLLQSVFCAAAFAVVCGKIAKYLICKWIKVFPVIFFSIIPVWGAYAQTVMKDVMYYGAFALFGVFYIEIIESKKTLNGWKWGIFVGLCIFLVQYRNEGIYIIVPSILLLLWCVIDGKIKIVISASVVILAHLFFSSVVLPGMNVAPGSKREMLSVPFQQTARYVHNYPDEVTDDEIAVINKILNYEAIKEKYNPINADPVKNTFHSKQNAELVAYAKIWWKHFKIHPECYVQATLNNCFGYFYPGYIQNSISNMQFYIKGEPIVTGDFDIYYVHGDNIRNWLSKYSLLWFKLPGLSLLMYPGTYSWLMLMCLGDLIRKRKIRECSAALPIALTTAICMISPVNGYLRYALPIMAFMPLFLIFTISNVSQTDTCTNKEAMKILIDEE